MSVLDAGEADGENKNQRKFKYRNIDRVLNCIDFSSIIRKRIRMKLNDKLPLSAVRMGNSERAV